jgi:hypothetical protein
MRKRLHSRSHALHGNVIGKADVFPLSTAPHKLRLYCYLYCVALYLGTKKKQIYQSCLFLNPFSPVASMGTDNEYAPIDAP